MKEKEFYWLNDLSVDFLSKGYLPEGVDAKQRIQRICEHAEYILKIEGFAEKMYNYMSKGWISLASPIWANFGTTRGLPISCFGSYVPDSMEGILDTVKEVGMMTKFGGGTSAYFGDVRGRGSPISRGGQSEGSVTFMRLFNTLIDVTKQADVRRGAFAAYLPVHHPDIEEFLKIKTEGNPIQNIFTGVTIEDHWMQEMIHGDLEKRKLWAKILKTRSEIGLPYIVFLGNLNRNKPEVYEDTYIRSQNLCAEIALPVAEDESFVCDLSSVNLVHYDDWKESDLIETVVFFLDAVMTDFIDQASLIPGFERAVKFAKRHRALGLGVLGWHDLLQSKMIAFDSLQANLLNVEIFKNMKTKAYEASTKLADRFGVPEVCKQKNVNRRNTTLLAIAPTTSSSFILGQVSQSIEPYRSNYYIKDLAKTKTTIRNPHLMKLLDQKGYNNEETWDIILMHQGSVQPLPFLSEEEKKVFETFSEISQMSILIQASSRQKYIDQGQSLNLMIHPRTPAKDINTLHIKAWELGIKSLYYQHSINAAQLFKNNLLTCSSCEG